MNNFSFCAIYIRGGDESLLPFLMLMNELYWISVLGNLKTIAIILSVLLGVVTMFLGVCYQDALEDVEKYHYQSFKESAIKTKNETFRFFMVALASFVCCLLITVFIPSKKELYLIYGVGTTIDYLKSNDTAKQLPDKAIKALDKWLDNKSNKDD